MVFRNILTREDACTQVIGYISYVFWMWMVDEKTLKNTDFLCLTTDETFSKMSSKLESKQHHRRRKSGV